MDTKTRHEIAMLLQDVYHYCDGVFDGDTFPANGKIAVMRRNLAKARENLEAILRLAPGLVTLPAHRVRAKDTCLFTAEDYRIVVRQIEYAANVEATAGVPVERSTEYELGREAGIRAAQLGKPARKLIASPRVGADAWGQGYAAGHAAELQRLADYERGVALAVEAYDMGEVTLDLYSASTPEATTQGYREALEALNDPNKLATDVRGLYTAQQRHAGAKAGRRDRAQGRHMPSFQGESAAWIEGYVTAFRA